MLPEETIETPGGLTPITSLTDSAEFEIKEPSLSVNNKIIKSNLRATMGVDLNTDYKDRVKSKVLWTGPLSVVGVPTSLDGGEDFNNWDLIIFNICLDSDTVINTQTTPLVLDYSSSIGVQTYTDLGKFRVAILSGTSFQLSVKGIATGNVQSIIGISL